MVTSMEGGVRRPSAAKMGTSMGQNCPANHMNVYRERESIRVYIYINIVYIYIYGYTLILSGRTTPWVELIAMDRYRFQD